MKVILACGRNVTADATEHLTALNGTKNVKLSDWIGYTQFLLGQIIASKNHTKKKPVQIVRVSSSDRRGSWQNFTRSGLAF